MAYLLDTNILSETRKRRPHQSLVAWLATIGRDDRHVSVLTLGEIARGATLLELRGRSADAGPLREWVAALRGEFAGRILDVDDGVVTAWSDIRVTRTLPLADSLIAATAVAHGLTVVTRNTRDYHDLGVSLIDPFVS